MRALFTILILVFSFLAFSGANHLDSCGANESCLINAKYNLAIKFIPQDNGFHLSSESFLADKIYPGVTLCFQGSAKMVCSILQFMSKTDGGHASIEKFECLASEKMIKLNFFIQYDLYEKEKVDTKIKKCK
jgi:hypothetical protein